MSYDIDIADEDFNYTWNMSRFFSRFGVHPYNDMRGRYTEMVADKIDFALEAVSKFDDGVLSERYDPDNKWGNVPGAVDWLTRIREACLRHPGVIVEAT